MVVVTVCVTSTRKHLMVSDPSISGSVATLPCRSVREAGASDLALSRLTIPRPAINTTGTDLYGDAPSDVDGPQEQVGALRVVGQDDERARLVLPIQSRIEDISTGYCMHVLVRSCSTN